MTADCGRSSASMTIYFPPLPPRCDCICQESRRAFSGPCGCAAPEKCVPAARETRIQASLIDGAPPTGPFRFASSFLPAHYAKAVHDGREPAGVVVLRRSPLYFLIARVVVRDHRVLSSLRAFVRAASFRTTACGAARRRAAVIARHDVGPLVCETRAQRTASVESDLHGNFLESARESHLCVRVPKKEHGPNGQRHFPLSAPPWPALSAPSRTTRCGSMCSDAGAVDQRTRSSPARPAAVGGFDSKPLGFCLVLLYAAAMPK